MAGALPLKEPEWEETALADSQEPNGVSESAAEAAPEPLEKRFFNLQTLISFLFAFAIIYFLVTKIDIDVGQTLARIRQANIWLYLAGFVVYYLSFPARALRWQVLLRNVGFDGRPENRLPSAPGLMEIIFLSWFANCVVPAKLGDAYRGYLLKQSTGVSFSKTMGTILAERIIDVVALFSLLTLAGLKVFHGHIPDALMSLFLFGAALVGLIIVVLVAMKLLGGHLQRRLPARLQDIYGKLEEGTLLSFRQLPLLIGYTSFIWLAEGGRFWLVAGSLGLTSVGLSMVIFIALASSLLTTLPVTPAGLGVVESALVAVLLLANNLGVIRGVDENLAASVAVLDRTISYWSIVVFGLIVYVASRRRR